MENKLLRCKQCLIKEGTRLSNDFYAVSKNDQSENTQSIALNSERICQYCVLYNQNYDKEFIDYELSYFLEENKENNFHSIVALSGGKDSITTLYIAKKILKLNVIAMTYDNGFIPKNIIEQSKEICDLLEVPYIVCKQDMYKEFKDEYKLDKQGVWQANTGQDFCGFCSKNIWKYIKKIAIEHNIYKVILGNKIYSKLSPTVSSLKKIQINDGDNIKKISCINLLFSMNISKTYQKEILNILGWRNPNLKGYTSNCLIPGFTEYPRNNKIETDSDAGYIEMELRSKMYTQQEAEELLLNKKYHDNSQDINNFFETIN